MNRSQYPGRTLLAICLLVFSLVAGTAVAQTQTGNIYGTIVDNTGAAIPGVTVTLTGGGAPRVAVTETDGGFRFPNLSPGRYTLKGELAGFGSVVRNNVEVNIGRNSELTLTLSPALEQTITVTAETPLLDTRRTGTGATVTQVELEQIPSARDPWTVLQSVPGVLVDRINVGGNESGQQSNYTAKGSSGDQNTWNIDGVAVTDMSATGSSNFYYNFDSVEEMQVTTGGTDPRIATPGVQLNLVMKRGTNELNGSGRYFWTDNEFQEDATVPTEAEAYLARANEINNITDMGLEVGGPIWKDRIWLWGAYGENQIDLYTAQNRAADGTVSGVTSDDTTLKSFSGKLNGQILSNNSAVLFYDDSDKLKAGRGVGPTREPETGWNQSGIGGTPTSIWKFEDTHIFSPSFYATGLYSKIKAGFQLTPVGGRDIEAYRDEAGTYHRSYYHYETERPQEQYRGDMSTFFDTGSLNHELKFGFGYRDAPVNSLTAFPGNGTHAQFRSRNRPAFAIITRAGQAAFKTDYSDLYVGDTILLGNLTLQAGLRYDLQHGSNTASTIEASTFAPELLPAINFPGDAEELEWASISPRIGMTYSFGSTRRTLIRGGYNRYVDQMGTSVVGRANPLAFSGLYYIFTDANNDKSVQRSEVDFSRLINFYGLDPDNPGSVSSPYRVDYDMEVPSTDEFILGVEHELMPEFTIGMNYTHRTQQDQLWMRFEKTKGAGDFYTAADYVLVDTLTGTTPGGESYSSPVYALRPGVDVPTFGVMTNRPDYTQIFDGFELNATKRLSNRWMLRGNVSWNDWTQDAGSNSYQDPTTFETALPQFQTFQCLGADCSGIVTSPAGNASGTKRGIYINSRWGYNLSGIYQLPWDIMFGAALTGREGYPNPYNTDVDMTTYDENSGEGVKRVYTGALDSARLDDLMNLDLRVAKDINISVVRLTLSLDAFNVTDERTVLQRENRDTAASNRIRELQSPRVLRFGARLNF